MESLLEVRNLLKEQRWKEYFNKLYSSHIKKPRTKKDFQIIKRNTRSIDMVILSKIAEKDEVHISELEKVIPPVQLLYRLEVMNHYNLVEYDIQSKTITAGSMFGSVDILELPINADQVPLSPREKLVYKLIKSSEETGGCRTVKDIYELDQMWGHKCSYFAIQLSVKYLEKIGVVEKSNKKFGYSAWYCKENLFVFESIEELVNICMSIDTPLSRRRKYED